MAGGRRSKYESHVEPKLLLIEAWTRDGMILEGVAEKLGVGLSTLCDYQTKYPELAEALKKGREVADVTVENALYEKALPKKIVLNKQKVLNDGEVIDYQEEVYVPGDVTAQIFWLKNRRPLSWRDKQDIGVEGDLTIKVAMPKGLTPDADD